VTDSALVGRLLDEYHERSVPASGVRLVAGSEHEARVSYHVTLPDGSAQTIRAFRADEPVPDHGRGTADQDLADWLGGRARTLAVLSHAAYPAPRPVRTRTGELIGTAGAWLTWATSFVPGPAIEPSLDQLRLTGAALAHLHSVAATPGASRLGDGPPGLASRHPAVAVPATLARLDAVASRVPAEWAQLCAAFRETAERVQAAAGTVAETLVHGEVWARTVVQPAPAGVTFVDWELGGLGLAVLDLGNALVECHLDAGLADDRQDRWLITPSPERVAALASGYAGVRALSAAEVSLLPAAAAFAAAAAGAVHFETALLDGVTGPTMDARLTRLRNRMAVAGQIADLARPHFLA
jgi:Ser/Thr protein kinase RdoA (MazF antagonist)